MYGIVSKVISTNVLLPAGDLISIHNLFFNEKFVDELILLYDFKEAWAKVQDFDPIIFESGVMLITDDKMTVYIITPFTSVDQWLNIIRSPEFQVFTTIKDKVFATCEWQEFPTRLITITDISDITIENIEQIWQTSHEYTGE